MHPDTEAVWRHYTRRLMAENRSEDTIDSYRKAVAELDSFLKRDVTTASTADLERYLGKRLKEIKATTVGIRYRSLRAFFNWCVREDYIEVSPMKNLKEPKAPDDPPPVLDDTELARLVKSCDGKGFEQRRDEAIIRVFSEPGSPRLAEMAGLTTDTLDMNKDQITVRGKGNKLRVIPFGVKTGNALERYLRVRSKHPQANNTTALWLGVKGPLSSSGIAQLLNRRSRTAGLGRIHPHQLRHTAAHAWADNGGSEGDAMALFGWSSPEMPRRYGRAAKVTRAQKAARKKSLGDRF
jgi:site-specific recombinase XerD